MIKYADLSEWYTGSNCKVKHASNDWVYNVTNGSLGQKGVCGQQQNIQWVTNAYAAQSSAVTVANWYSALAGDCCQTAITGSVYVNEWQWSLVDTAADKAARRKREAERMAAKTRAERLLFTILTPTQVKRYTDDGYFEQEVGGRIYRLHANSRSGNVVLLEDGKPKFKYCAHPEDSTIPVPDVLLSQLLMLKANEQDFLKIANRTEL